MWLKDLVDVVSVLLEYKKNPIKDESFNKRVDKRILTYLKKLIKATDNLLNEKKNG